MPLNIFKKFKVDIPNDQLVWKALKYGVMYSFGIWLGIIGWNVYNQFKQYEQLSKENQKVEKEFQKILKEYKKYKTKLEDINLAYKEISKAISPQAVKKLIDQIDQYVIKIQNEKNTLNLNQLNPYRIDGFNIQILAQIPPYLQPVTLADIPLTSRAVSDFQSVLQSLINVWRGKQAKSLTAEVGVKYKANKVVLFLEKSDKGYLEIKPQLLYGVISDFQKIPYFLTSTAIDSRLLEQNIRFSQLYIGWGINLKTLKEEE